MMQLGWVVLIRRSVYMSVLLCVHCQNDVFPFTLHSPNHQFPINFQIACKLMIRLSGVAGMQSLKPKLYYYKKGTTHKKQ